MKKYVLSLAFALLAGCGFSQIADPLVTVKAVDSLIQVSRSLTGQGDFDKALEVNAVAERLALEKLGRESAAYGNCCHNRAKLANFKRNLPEAEKWYMEALSVREEVLGKSHPDYSASLTNLGILYKDLSNYEKAEQLQLEAKAIMEKAVGKNNADYAPCLFNLANLYEIIGDYEKAEQLYLEAKSLVEKTLGKDHPGYIRCLNNLGNLYMDLGNNEKAEQLYLESNAIREKKLGNKHPLYANGLFSLATVYRAKGQYEKAEPLYLESKAIRDNTLSKSHPDYVVLLEELGTLYLNMGQYEKAEPFYLEAIVNGEKAFGLEHPEYAKNLDNLAFLHWRKGEFQKAEPLYLEAKSIREKAFGKENPDYLVNLFILYEAQGRYAESESLMKDFFGLTQTRFLQSTAFLSERELANYGSTFRFNGNHLLGYLFSRFEKGNPLGLLPGMSYDQVIFQKGFLLTAATRLQVLASSSSESKEINNALLAYRRRLAAEYTKPIAERNNANVATFEEKANTLEKDLARTVAGYGEATRQVKWQEVQAALQPGEAAVEFIHYAYYTPNATDSTLYAALVLRPLPAGDLSKEGGDTEPTFVPLFEKNELKELMRGASGGSNFLKINALYSQKNLYDLIWRPLEPMLTGIKTVYCAPSGLLHRLNLAAMATPEGKVYGERRQLVVLGSTRSLAVGTKASQLVVPNNSNQTSTHDAYLAGGIRYDSDSTAMAYANRGATSRSLEPIALTFQPDSLSITRGGVLDYLPATAAEVREIGQTLRLGRIETKVDTGFYATEESFRQLGVGKPSPRIIHLATHGYFFPDPAVSSKKQLAGSPAIVLTSAGGSEPVFKISDHPMIRSGLIMAGAKQAWLTGKHPEGQEDGILTSYEISQMNLSGTELVVLSACETGLGDIVGNEGVYGLQRAFKIAGVKYLIMSLWKVDDKSTRAFMTSFYRHWLTETQTVPQAFRSTQQEMRAKYAGAYDWAGFVLIE